MKLGYQKCLKITLKALIFLHLVNNTLETKEDFFYIVNIILKNDLIEKKILGRLSQLKQS